MKRKRDAKPKRERFYVAPVRDLPHQPRPGWDVYFIRRGKRVKVDWAPTQRRAIARAKSNARGLPLVSLYVCGKTGRYRLEWTYPRSSDPRKTRG